MLKIYRTIKAYLRNPLVSLIVYPVLMYWLFFNAFPVSLDGSMAAGAFVFTITALAGFVFLLKLLLVPISLAARAENRFLRLFQKRTLSYTPLSYLA